MRIFFAGGVSCKNGARRHGFREPIADSNIGRIPELIEQDRSRLLAEPSAAGIGIALLRLSHTRVLCERISENSKNDRMRHSWKQMSEAYMRLHEKACRCDECS